MTPETNETCPKCPLCGADACSGWSGRLFECHSHYLRELGDEFIQTDTCRTAQLTAELAALRSAVLGAMDRLAAGQVNPAVINRALHRLAQGLGVHAPKNAPIDSQGMAHIRHLFQTTNSGDAAEKSEDESNNQYR